MKKKNESYNILFIAGVNSKYKLPHAQPAGFWIGLWHGIIAPIVFIVGLFTPKISVYETHNNGRWYDFGFLLGVGAFTRGAQSASR
jgi:hypothetical protein